MAAISAELQPPTTGPAPDPSGELLRLTAASMKLWWRTTGLRLLLVYPYLALPFLAILVFASIYHPHSVRSIAQELDAWLRPLTRVLPLLLWYLALSAAQAAAAQLPATAGPAASLSTPLARFRLYALQGVPALLLAASSWVLFLLLPDRLGQQPGPASLAALASALQTSATELAAFCKLGWLLCLVVALLPRAGWLFFVAMGARLLGGLITSLVKDTRIWPLAPQTPWSAGCALAFVLVTCSVLCLWRARSRQARALLLLVFLLYYAGIFLRLLMDLSPAAPVWLYELHGLLIGAGHWTSCLTLHYEHWQPATGPALQSLALTPLTCGSLRAGPWAVLAVLAFNLGQLPLLYWLLRRIALSALPAPAEDALPVPPDDALSAPPAADAAVQ